MDDTPYPTGEEVLRFLFLHMRNVFLDAAN